MIPTDDQRDGLLQLWQGAAGPPPKEDYQMLLQLVQEKQKSLLDLLREQNMSAYLISMCFAPLTAFSAWRGRQSIWLWSGYLLMTAVLVAGAVVVWLYARRAAAAGRTDLTTREHQQQLLELYDSRIRFEKSVKYWYALPLFAGAGLAGYPIGAYLLGPMWGLVLVSGFLAVCWIGVWHMHDVRAVADLRRRREEVNSVLDDLDRN